MKKKGSGFRTLDPVTVLCYSGTPSTLADEGVLRDLSYVTMYISTQALGASLRLRRKGNILEAFCRTVPVACFMSEPK